MIETPIPLIDLHAQHESIKEEVLTRFSRIIDASAFTLGAEVQEFEEKFASYCQASHAVGVANGTDALVLALRALEVGPGDEVITVANTFVATTEAIAHVGATPILVDIDATTYEIDVALIEQAITPKTKAIIPVHIFGYPADMDPILDLAKKHGLFVIEDAAQAHGAEYRNRRIGSLGDVACFSFYPSKNLGAFGDAGAVVTNNEEVATRLRQLRDHGSSQKYDHKFIGYTSRLDALQAAVLNVKLSLLDGWNQMRRKNAGIYDELLSGLPGLVLPVVEAGRTHVYYLYVVRLESGNRDALADYLGKNSIGTGIHYPTPVHLTEAFSYLGYEPGSFPIAEQYADQILSVPMYPQLESEQIAHVARQLTAFVQGK